MTFHAALSVSETTASVPKPAEMVAAEAELAGVQSELQERNGEYNKLLERLRSAERGESHGNAVALRIEVDRIQVTISDLNQHQSRLRSIIAAHKPGYAAALCLALSPLRQNMALRAVAAIVELKAVTSALRESHDAINAYGGSATRLPLPIYSDPIRAIAQKIAAGESA